MKTVSYQEYVREIEMGINISGTGDIPSIYAKRFAYCVEEAAAIAEQLSTTAMP